MLVFEWKERVFIEKVNSRCFCWFAAAILVHQNGTPVWRLHSKLYKGAWNVSSNNSETVGHKDLRLGKIVYMLVFYNISFSWLLPPDGFQYIFFCCVTVKTIYKNKNKLSPTQNTPVLQATLYYVISKKVWILHHMWPMPERFESWATYNLKSSRYGVWKLVNIWLVIGIWSKD